MYRNLITALPHALVVLYDLDDSLYSVFDVYQKESYIEHYCSVNHPDHSPTSDVLPDVRRGHKVCQRALNEKHEQNKNFVDKLNFIPCEPDHRVY